jgi:hypothetical protein
VILSNRDAKVVGFGARRKRLPEKIYHWLLNSVMVSEKNFSGTHPGGRVVRFAKSIPLPYGRRS